MGKSNFNSFFFIIIKIVSPSDDQVQFFFLNKCKYLHLNKYM